MDREVRHLRSAAPIERDEVRVWREERHPRSLEGGECDEVRGDRAVAAVAAAQHGVVTGAQLAAAGIRPDAITRRIAAGHLTRLHRGVYQVGPVAAARGREMAALLACGDGAVLSHHSAAAVWGFRPAWEGDVHVTVAGRQGRHRPGIRVHRTTIPFEVATMDGLALTSPRRTLEDLATLLPQRDLARAVEQAQILFTASLQAGSSSRRGTTKLTRALATEPSLTRSEAEHRLLGLIRRARLPSPRTNVHLAGYEVDLAWPLHRLIVEVDGFAFHSTRQAFERDRRKDAELVAAGYRVVRVTWRQIVGEPEAIVARVAALLA